MGAIQSILASHEQRSLTREFGWETTRTPEGNIALYPLRGRAVLAEHGLEGMVANPGDEDLLDSILVKPLESGSFASAYEIADTGLVVKKHFPDMYEPGHEGTNAFGHTYMRRIGSSTVLRDLSVNLWLERGLKHRPHYATPDYLGHLMLKDESGEARHYTLMTKLDEFIPAEEQGEEQDGIVELKRNAQVNCVMALRAAGRSVWFIDWDIGDERGYHNLIPFIDETEGLSVGVIDQRSSLSRGKLMRRAPLVARSQHDPDAPWLPITSPFAEN